MTEEPIDEDDIIFKAINFKFEGDVIFILPQKHRGETVYYPVEAVVGPFRI